MSVLVCILRSQFTLGRASDFVFTIHPFTTFSHSFIVLTILFPSPTPTLAPASSLCLLHIDILHFGFLHLPPWSYCPHLARRRMASKVRGYGCGASQASASIAHVPATHPELTIPAFPRSSRTLSRHRHHHCRHRRRRSSSDDSKLGMTSGSASSRSRIPFDGYK